MASNISIYAYRAYSFLLTCGIVAMLIVGAFTFSSCDDDDCDNTSSATTTATLSVGPMTSFVSNFNDALCVPFSNPIGFYQQWANFFNNDYTVFIKISPADGCNDWLYHVRYCSLNGLITKNYLNEAGQIISGTPDLIYNGNELYISVLQNRPVEITVTINTMCDFCKNGSSQLHTYRYDNSNTYNNLPPNLNYTIDNLPYRDNFVCTQTCN